MPHDKVIEYFHSAHSAYAYLGAWELERIAGDAGWDILHRPFDFAPVMQAAGGASFAARSRAHIDYFYGREITRWAEMRGLPMIRHRPTYHDSPLDRANGMIIAAQGAAGPMSRAILKAHWEDDADLADRATLIALADGLGLDGRAVLAAAETMQVQDQHQRNTQEAIARSVFGSPTYFVRGDMFYGQDRLALVERAIQRPFAP